MKKIVQLMSVLLATAILAGCGAAAKPLTEQALKNAEYMTEVTLSKKAKLTDGKFEEAAAPGSASKNTVMLADKLAIADLNKDGAQDAAVVLISSGGGSGTFYHLAAVLNDKGAPRHVSSILLGDRIKLKNVTVKNGEITVEMTMHGPNDPLCCPTQEVSKVYTLQAEKLVQK